MQNNKMIPNFAWVSQLLILTSWITQTLKQVFSMVSSNHVTLKLLTSSRMLTAPHLYHTQYVWIDFTVLILALISLLLTFKYIQEVGSLYNEIRIQNATNNMKRAYTKQRETYRKIKKQNEQYKNELSSMHGGSIRGGQGGGNIGTSMVIDSSISDPPLH